VPKYLRLSTYKEERFILAHRFRGFWPLGPIALGLWWYNTSGLEGMARRPVYFMIAKK
jgi:hypothetical protein